jgi:hypothetical protein
MRKATLAAGALMALLAAPALAQNNAGPATGAATGAVGGALVGGPVGAVVGGVTGAIVGGIAESNEPRFREYVVRQDVQSYRYKEPVTVGTVLPAEGVRYHEVPAEFDAPNYRYTVVNDRTVLVDPRSRRVVQIIE